MFILHCTSVGEQPGGKIQLQFAVLQPAPEAKPATPATPARNQATRQGQQYPGYTQVGNFSCVVNAADAVPFGVGKEFTLAAK